MAPRNQRSRIHAYEVRRPCVVPVRKAAAGGLEVAADKLGHFWEKAGRVARRRGCYVFGMRHGETLRIFYVGRTTDQKFKGECFRPHKMRIYNKVLARAARRQAVLIFVTPTERRGNVATVTREIKRIEKWLINAAYRANPGLMNKQLVKRPASWRIAGVTPGTPGKTSQVARLLRRSLKPR